MSNLKLATLSDLDEIVSIIEAAKLLLKEEGLTQWQSGSPTVDMLKQDIINHTSYVYLHEGYIAGVINIQTEPDVNYLNIEGQWQQDNEAYITLHRIATHALYRNESIAQKMILSAIEVAKEKGILQLRVDTHRDNYRMIYLVQKLGFEFAGVVDVNDPIDSKRNAYQYFIKPS